MSNWADYDDEGEEYVDESCDHEAWECYIGGVSAWHKCSNGCDFNWLGGTRDGDENCEVCKSHWPGKYVTKDSGKREEYDSGMRRDTQEGKPRFDLLLVDGVPYEDQFLTRFAGLLERGASKYGERNWQLADSNEELARFRASALRHLMQWATGEDDEDHAAAVAFNLMAYESIKYKLERN